MDWEIRLPSPGRVPTGLYAGNWAGSRTSAYDRYPKECSSSEVGSQTAHWANKDAAAAEGSSADNGRSGTPAAQRVPACKKGREGRQQILIIPKAAAARRTQIAKAIRVIVDGLGVTAIRDKPGPAETIALKSEIKVLSEHMLAME